MDKQRKETIVHEIKYWKENHLLPSHYCDFLLALYTEGMEESAVDDEDKKKKNNQQASLLPHLYALVMIALIPLFLVGHYLLNFEMALSILAIIISLMITTIMYFLALKYKMLKASYTLTVYLISFFVASLVFIDILQLGFIPRVLLVIAQLLYWVYLAFSKRDLWVSALATLVFIILISSIFI